MRRQFGRLVGIPVVVGILLAVSVFAGGTTASAQADVDVGVFQGGGSAAPGLGALPAAQSFNIGGEASLVGTRGVLPIVSCGFTGTDFDGSWFEGAGFMSGGCAGLDESNCPFVRVGVHLLFECVGFGGSFEILWDQTPPAVILSFHVRGLIRIA